MTGSLDEKAWILSQKGPAQYAEEPVFIQPMHTKNADSCTKALENIQIQNFGGVYELRGFLRALVNAPGFQTVQSIGIVRDAEVSAERAFQSVQSSLSNAALPVPDRLAERTNTSPAVAVLILPGDNRQGMLETLLCESFAATPVEDCIDDFFKCVESLPDVSIERSDKARAYLTTKPNPHFSVGVAAKNDYWNLDHSVFSTIRDFLQTIAATGSPPVN